MPQISGFPRESDTLVAGSTPVIATSAAPLGALSVCNFPGADAGQKIANAIAALPAAGGTVDARCLFGPQTISADPFVGVTVPVDFFATAVTFTVSANTTMLPNIHLVLGDGAVFAPNAGVTLNIQGPMDGSSLSPHFAGAGTTTFLANLHLREAFPQWFGATGDNVHDDTAAIQAALDASRGALSGLVYTSVCPVTLPNGAYRVTNQLNMYATTGSYSGAWLRGSSKYAAIINWNGPAAASVIRMIGYAQKISDIQIINLTGWLDAITYDGDPAIGVSTGGLMDNVRINGNNLAGNGISFGRNQFQSDTCSVRDAYIFGCISGYGLVIMNPNAISNTVYNPAVSHCWVGMGTTASTVTIKVFGGEFDNNDVNFLPQLGVPCLIHGVRSEGSKHGMHTFVGAAPQSISITSYTMDTTYWSENTAAPRPATNGTTSGSNGLTLSVPNSVTFGDWIIVAGAGPSGANVSCRIANMTSPTQCTVDNGGFTTPVTNAVVTFDTTHQQQYFSLSSGGPFAIASSRFNVTQAETSFLVPNGPISWVGNAWSANLPNPINFIFTGATNSPWPSGIDWFGNVTNYGASGSGTPMADHQSSGLQSELFFGSNNVAGAANNAWVLNGQEPLAPGLRLQVYASTFSLQIGANTLSYNGTGNFQIIKASAAGGNLTTAAPVGSVVTLVYDPNGNWRFIGQ